ncbi:MAG: response regulator [Alphaproteobacteria bacterium]|nr:response regulator [Alphaproteobacteria bacterium]
MNGSAKPGRVLVADDHELFRDAIKRLVSDAWPGVALDEAGDLDGALEQLASEGAIDLVLIDLRMPGLNGPESLAALREGYPDSKIIVVSASESKDDILAALGAGVHGYVPKTLPSKSIRAAIENVLGGGVYVPAQVTERSSSEAMRRSLESSMPHLTARQNEVLEALETGASNKEIARKLNLTEGTVKIHLAAIYRQIAVKSRGEAIAWSLARKAKS